MSCKSNFTKNVKNVELDLSVQLLVGKTGHTCITLVVSIAQNTV